MRSSLRPAICRNCGRERAPDQLDDLRWCEVCRKPLIRRAALWARGIALVLTLALGVWIAFAVRPSSRFLVAWMAILAVTYLVITRIAQRIAFEVIRSRAISTAES